MKKLTFLFLFLLLLAAIQPALAQQKQVKAACIGFYNLENLFDTEDDPLIDDAEFLPNGSNGWTDERYQAKLKNMAEVVNQIGDELIKDGPIIMGLSEVENRRVVEDLVKTAPLSKREYKVVHFNSPDRRGIDVALIYQPKYFRLLNAEAHPFKIATDTGFRSRDILQVDGVLDNDTIHVLVNHWPSRSGGQQESVYKRNAAADLCLSIVHKIYEKNPRAKIIIMGDLNDDPTDASLIKHLKVKGKPEQVHGQDLYDPMWQMYRDGIGSLAYKDSWNLFDQIIVSAPLLEKQTTGYSFLKAKIFNKKFVLQKDGGYAGYPFRTFAGGVYQGGYSDHLPVYIFLVRETQ